MFRKEYGTRRRRTLCGRKIKKTSTLRKKKERKLIKNGRKETICPFLKLEKWRIKIKPTGPNRTGATEGWVDMDGSRANLKVRREVEISRTTRLRQ